MYKLISFKAIIFIFLSSLVSCNEAPDQGPCDYTEEEFNMRVIDVSENPEEENMYIVLVDFDGNIDYAEGQHTFAEVRNVTTDFDFVINNNIKVGNIYTGTVHKRIGESTHCDEQIIDWDQKLFRPAKKK